MKNVNFILVLALSMLLMLGACKKNESTSSGDPTTSEGKIELGIAALGTDGKILINKLESKGWVLDKEESMSEETVYKKDNELCAIVFEENKVCAVSYHDEYKSFDDAKKALNNYHSATTKKYNKNYSGRVGFDKTFSSPSDWMDYVNSLSEADIIKFIDNSSAVLEDGMNTKETFLVDNGISFYVNYLWVVNAAVVTLR